MGSGSGFIITQDGFAITCAHVIKNAKEVFVRLETQKGFDVVSAEVISADYNADIALLKLEDGVYNYALISEDDKPMLGEEIVIYGYPFGRRMHDDVMQLSISFAKGYVSSNQCIGGINKTLLDISAKAGNSGSPIISVETGRVIGILCGSITGGHNSIEEINYMLPISYIDLLVDTDE